VFSEQEPTNPNEYKVLIHIVTFNHEKTIARTLESTIAIKKSSSSLRISILVSDNKSTDKTLEILRDFVAQGEIELNELSENFGFCLAHNISVHTFLNKNFDYLLILNPDILLTPNSIEKMIDGFKISPSIGAVTPKINRCDQDMRPISPAIVDAAGMKLNQDLRHLDRGSGELDTGQFDEREFVFGGTGACLLINRIFAKDLVLNNKIPEKETIRIYPQYLKAPTQRLQLFDEGFFAYREDAELAWRANLLGWRYLYEPQSQVFHVRRVVPDNRDSLPTLLNLLSVKNRFLMQLNCYSPKTTTGALWRGFILRNFIVVIGVLIKEQSSLPGLIQSLKLFKRALKIRREIATRINGSVFCER